MLIPCLWISINISFISPGRGRELQIQLLLKVRRVCNTARLLKKKKKKKNLKKGMTASVLKQAPNTINTFLFNLFRVWTRLLTYSGRFSNLTQASVLSTQSGTAPMSGIEQGWRWGWGVGGRGLRQVGVGVEGGGGAG